MTIDIHGGKFYCSQCKGTLTIKSEDGGKAFSARCKTCKKTLNYPECEKCGQGTWRHDDRKCASVYAISIGKRYCYTCEETKETSEFNFNGNSISSRCKSCQSDYYKDWYAGKQIRENSRTETDYESVLDELFGDM